MVNGLLQSGRDVRNNGFIYAKINGVDVKLFRPEQARKKFKGRNYISKPTFYDWVKKGIIRKTAHPLLEVNDYRISDEEIARVKKLMTRDWKLGRKKISKA